jgi:hypothetical protein
LTESADGGKKWHRKIDFVYVCNSNETANSGKSVVVKLLAQA